MTANPVYRINRDALEIIDQELGLAIQAPLFAKGRTETCHEDGKLKSICYYNADVAQLHGPSEYYSPSGKLLSRSWFVFGQLQGKCWQYYPNGDLHALLSYKDNLPEGIHKYYYPGNKIKTVMPYQGGRLEGLVQTYEKNGKIKRELFYREGKVVNQ